MQIIIFIGSVASGKSTIAKVLLKEFKKEGYTVKYVNVNVNQGVAFLLTRLISNLLKYKYIGNSYLTIRFNNKQFFCKYINLMELLDLLFIPIKYFITVKVTKWLDNITRKKYILLLDEYYINSLVEYMYFTKFLCKKNRSLLNQLLYRVSIYTVRQTLLSGKSLIIFLENSLYDSVKGWILREKTNIVDIEHIIVRKVGTKKIISYLRNAFKAAIREFYVHDLLQTLKSIVIEVKCLLRNH